ncbi:YybH family protein [Ferruginibacter sp. SUN106]|uniref:YybH family protein n=1 Tax=Ferruginibacter sp. SUN106 TaxID=2978348 RepID=UPI003D360329
MTLTKPFSYVAKKISCLSLVFCFLFCHVHSTIAQTAKFTADSSAVTKTMSEFVHVFNYLEWEKFMTFFDDDATAFFPPSAKTPARADNKTAIGIIFKKVFENAKGQKITPPYLDIVPEDLKLQLTGNIAIVTFHLKDPDMFGRRTIVLQKKNNRWLIIHLHASGIPVYK